MSNPGVDSAAGLLLVLAALLFGSRAAIAGDVGQTCRDAYYQAQVLRDEGKLEEAIGQAKTCVRTCGEELARDCEGWRQELETRTASTIVIVAVDGAGANVTNALVSLDGVPWLDRLDGTAQTVPKGAHTLRVDVDGAVAETKSIVVRQGEKDRKIQFFIRATPSDDGARLAHQVGPWVVGGVGLGALIAGTVTGALVVHDHGVTRDECSDATATCSQEGLDAASRGRVLGPVTTGLLVGGGALVAAGVVWLVAAPRDDRRATRSFLVAPLASLHEAGIVLGGAW